MPATPALRLLHLVGSAVSDFYADLSRLYAGGCLAALDGQGYESHIAHIDPTGRWRFPASLDAAAVAAAEPVSVAEAVQRIVALEVDLAVPQMFDLPGMTTYRALLDLLDIPFVGNPADVMANAADKARARAIVAAAGVPVPGGSVVRRGQAPECANTDQPLPVVVKPVDADNSLGVSLVRDAADLPVALGAAFEHSDRALVESYIELGREVRCGVVERDGELVCLPLEEYAVGAGKPIRDHADKLSRDDDGLRLVAKDADHAWIVDPSDPDTAAVWEVARSCHTALGCRDYSLFDFRIDPDGKPWFLEASLYCSYAPSSVLVSMAAADGVSVQELFAAAATSVLRRVQSRG